MSQAGSSSVSRFAARGRSSRDAVGDSSSACCRRPRHWSFWWLDSATVYALGLAVIAAIYVGFAVADGRPKVIAVESSVTFAFVVVAAAAITDHRGCSWPAWPATDSRTSGSTEPTSSPTRDGGRRSA
jgi:hypothetical protein